MSIHVNRIEVSDEAINRESANVETGSIEERHAEAARRLAVRELLRQRAEEIGIATEDRPDEAIEELLAEEVQLPEADEDACQRYFEANRERFRTPEEVELRHILLAAAPDDAHARKEQRDRAESLIETLEASPERFAELAESHSACPSREEGGHLGLVGRGQTVPELEQVFLRLPVDLADRPVETRYGFHVIEVLSRQGGEPLDFESVRSLIADYLTERGWRRAVSQYIQLLAARAEIEGIDLEAADSPLVQ